MMYCDGKAGCGAVIREFFEEGLCTDEHLSKRRGGNFSSSTSDAELQAIYEGLLIACLKCQDIDVFVDSQSALLFVGSLNDACLSSPV